MLIFYCKPKSQLIKESVEIFKNITGIQLELKECLYKLPYIDYKKIAEFRVLNPSKNETNINPFQQEIEFEREKIYNCKCGKGIIYSGIELVKYLRNIEEIKKLKFTDRPVFITLDYIATFDKNDRRWHLRYALFSFPVIISLKGILEAPAKPKEYYFYIAQGFLPEMIPADLKEKFLTENDRRLPRVLAGILLQAYAYYILKNPFCENKFCSLYNAHWQEELLNSQKDEPFILCEKHKKLLGLRI